MAKPTICDIAERCGISPTVVSAVLNRPGARSRCSLETRALIEQTARELNYWPNLLAQSMVLRHVPVVALMLHKPQSSAYYGSRYFSTLAAALNFSLRERSLEILLSFYRNEDEQIERFRSLLSNGLIGGVISNLVPANNARFIRAVQESSLPYVVLGHPAVPALSLRDSIQIFYYRELMEHYQTCRCYIHHLHHNEHGFYLYEDRKDYDFNQVPALPPTQELAGNPENLIVSQSLELYVELSAQMPIACPVIMADSTLKNLIPPGVSYLLSQQTSQEKRAELAASLIADWMQGKAIPEQKETILTNTQGTELHLC